MFEGDNGKKQDEEEANAVIIAVVLLVALTVLSASSLFLAISGFDVPQPEGPFEEEASPFAVKYVEGTLTGSANETALYDSTADDVSGYSFEGGKVSPPSMDVTGSISDLRGSPSIPDTFVDGKLRIPSGDYYVDTDETRFGFGDDTIVFDTTDGPVRIAVAEAGSISASANFEVQGGHHVEFYVDRSNLFGNDLYIFDSTFENHRTGAVRIYARSDGGGDTSDVKIENTEFRGIVYAPGTSVEFVDSTVYGASIADETRLDSSSYYHDEYLERFGTDVLP